MKEVIDYVLLFLGIIVGCTLYWYKKKSDKLETDVVVMKRKERLNEFEERLAKNKAAYDEALNDIHEPPAYMFDHVTSTSGNTAAAEVGVPTNTGGNGSGTGKGH